MQIKGKVIQFNQAIDVNDRPDQFTYPFYYQPHTWSIQAAEQIQAYLLSQQDFEHNFGLDNSDAAIGKMFGVLVVEVRPNEFGFLAAVSGKLANSNHHSVFVPPVFDMLEEGSYFRKEEQEINAITLRIEALETQPELYEAKAFLAQEEDLRTIRLEEQRAKGRLAKQERKQWRAAALEQLQGQALEERLGKIKHESLCFKFYLKDLIHYWDLRIQQATEKVNRFMKTINLLKKERKQRSAALQKRLFSEYDFLNIRGERQSLEDIFSVLGLEKPPAGAGECAAPKLLHYAFNHGLKPVCMAEFWWGMSPKSEVRKHKHFYPACRGKCYPILGHMLAGMDVADNPLEGQTGSDKQLQILHEDEDLLVIVKPHEFLSVPGKVELDSVYTRIQEMFPSITGPIIVHRLDMATSGIMLLAKNKEAHRALQAQFIERTVKKRYEALLEGELNEDKGRIELPLRVDLEDRPRQLVCYEHGKSAVTIWEKRKVSEGRTKVYFYPITGRTHQLRVHAAHHLGLNAAIVGDDLYGQSADRLHLHAGFISFNHPSTGKPMKFSVPAEF